MRFLMFVVWAGCVTAEPEGPSIAVLAPADDSVVCGSPLAVELAVEHFRFPENGDAGDGHIDVSLNGQSVAMVAELVFEVDTEPGVYELVAQLVTSEHVPIEPEVLDVSTFEVREDRCGGEG